MLYKYKSNDDNNNNFNGLYISRKILQLKVAIDNNNNINKFFKLFIK